MFYQCASPKHEKDNFVDHYGHNMAQKRRLYRDTPFLSKQKQLKINKLITVYNLIHFHWKLPNLFAVSIARQHNGVMAWKRFPQCCPIYADKPSVFSGIPFDVFYDVSLNKFWANSRIAGDLKRRESQVIWIFTSRDAIHLIIIRGHTEYVPRIFAPYPRFVMVFCCN